MLQVPERGQNIMEMHFLMLFRGQNAQILLFRRETAPQNAKCFSPDTWICGTWFSGIQGERGPLAPRSRGHAKLKMPDLA